MELNYIILAHKNPDQVSRLVNRLNSIDVFFYIHIDKEVDKDLFENQLSHFSNVYFLNEEEREPGIWGDIGIVKATLRAMNIIVSHNREGYCILLSGQDYPLAGNSDIKSFFEEYQGTNFISISEIAVIWGNSGFERITRYKINKSSKRGHFLLLPSVFSRAFYQFKTLGNLNYLRKTKQFNEIKNIFKERKFPDFLSPFGGSVYFALPTKTITQVLDVVRDHPEYLDYHKYTLCVDEIFFHSIIMHLNTVKPLPIAPSLTYANWKRKKGPFPATFRKVDFQELERASRNHLFARKFDLDQDREILEIIDNTFLKD